MDLIDAMVKARHQADDIERIEVSPYIPERSGEQSGRLRLPGPDQFSSPSTMAMSLKGAQRLG